MHNEKKFRPNVKDVYNLLHKHEALIVHFSGSPKGVGIEQDDHLYPKDLTYVLNGQAISGVSCSTVMPRDNFHSPGRNATGCIGVILGFKNSHSLIDAHPYDYGSSLDVEGKRLAAYLRDINIEQLENTILSRKFNSYNEWSVCEYEVLGIFAVEPFEVSFLSEPLKHPDMPDFMQSTKLERNILSTNFLDVINDFKGLPVYTFRESKICLVKNSSFIPITHREIYK